MTAELRTLTRAPETATERARRLAREAAQAGLDVWHEGLPVFNATEAHFNALADLESMPPGVRQEAKKAADALANSVRIMAAIMERAG